MNIIKVSSPVYTEAGLIDLTLVIDDGRVMQFTASPNDSEVYGRDLYDWAVAGEYGGISPWQGNSSPAVNAVEMRQLRLHLLSINKLQLMSTTVGSSTEAIRIEWEYATVVHREGVIATVLESLMNCEEVDRVFESASKL